MIRRLSILFTLALTACAAYATSITQPPQLVGTWKVAEFKLQAKEGAHVPSGEGLFTIVFDANGEASGQVACNNWKGRYTLASGKLSIEKPLSTRKRCIIADDATAKFAPLFLSRLEKGARVKTTGDEMELIFADGLRWRFQRQPSGEPTISR